MTRRRDTFKWWLVFRDAATGKYCTRAHAFRNPATTVSERREKQAN